MLRQKTVVLKTGDYPVKSVDKNGSEIIENVFTDFKRDDGKNFRFTEMSAVKLEKWSIKCGVIARKVADKQDVSDMKEVEEGMSATLAYLSFAMSNEKHFFEFLDCFNELLYNYEIYDKDRDCYIKITPENEAQYIEEVVTVGFLRNKAMEFLNFFQQGGNANTIPEKQQQPPEERIGQGI